MFWDVRLQLTYLYSLVTAACLFLCCNFGEIEKFEPYEKA